MSFYKYYILKIISMKFMKVYEETYMLKLYRKTLVKYDIIKYKVACIIIS